VIHPDTQLLWIGPQIGLGVFATAPIPAGTIVWVQDALDTVLSPDSTLLADPAYKPILEKYAFRDGQGKWIVCWDNAKYVNHCCHCSAMSTGFGFEIAIRDIAPGEELTDEYVLLNLESEVPLVRHHPDCRQAVRVDDLDRYADQWDEQVRRALREFARVPQPLLPYLDGQTYQEVKRFLATGEGYKSVRSLSYTHRR